MEHHSDFISVFGETSFKAYKNLSFLVTSQGHLSRLQDSKLHEREKVVSFQWLGPQFLAFLKYATTLLQLSDKYYNGLCDMRDLLKRLDDSASDCIVYGETEHYKNFLEIIHSFMPQIRKIFTIQNLLQLFDRGLTGFRECFIDFLFETIGELLNCRMYSSVLVSNQVIVLLKELRFLLTFLVDTARRKEEQNKNIRTEIDAVFSEAGLFLHSFFFTTDLVTMTTMDLAISVLLERLEIVRNEIKDHCVAVSMKLNSGIGSLIVMDDLWDIHAWDDLKRYFPDDNNNGSRLLFTSRLKNVALETSHVIIEPPLLSPDESWNLLKQKVFKKEGCPQELQDIGIQIATNCHGLPLSVILVAGLLSNMEKEESLWQLLGGVQTISSLNQQ